MAAFLTPEEIERRCISRQCVLIGDYTKSSAVATFRCTLCGGEFQATFNKVTNERKDGEPGCRKCYATTRQRPKLDRYLHGLREYAESRGGTILTTQINSAKDRVTFRCSNEHEWSAVASAIKNQRTWCPHCAGQTLRTLDELRQITEARGGRLLSTEYSNVDTKYDFECVLGHRFSNSFKKVESGQWCPTCNKGRISEEVARTTFEQLFGVPFPKERPQWLRNSRSRLMEIDGANLDLGIGFEYHGAQHFRKTLYIKDDAGLAQRQEDDATKERLCREHGIALVVLTHEMTYPVFPEQIRSQLLEHGIDVSRVVFTTPIDLARAYVRTDRLEELRELLAPKNIEVISTAWLGSDTPYDLKCHTCGHLWSAPGNMFFNSRRVAGCDCCNRKKAGERNNLGLATLVEYATSKGGELLSTDYVKRNHYYRWRCSVGHEFDGNYNNMAHRHQFCPVCEARMKRKRKT